MADNLEQAPFETQHYTLITRGHPDAIDGQFFPMSNNAVRLDGLALLLAITPAVDLPPNYFNEYLGNRFQPHEVRIIPAHVQKGDKAQFFTLTTENRDDEAKRRLRVTKFLMHNLLNMWHDPDAYLRTVFESAPDDVPDDFEDVIK